MAEDDAALQEARSRRFVVAFGASAIVCAGVWAAGVLLLDALYDTSAAALARSRSFNAAIIGNSRIINVDPATLSERTGSSFASLAMPGIWPNEQVTVLRTFLRHHAEPRALVFGLDETWCMDPLMQARRENFRPEEFDDSFWRPFADALRPGSLAREQLGPRFRMLLGLTRPRLDGYQSYDANFHAAGADDIEVVRAKFSPMRPTSPYTSEQSFPAAALMRSALREVPADTAVVLVWPPVHISVVAVPGSAAAKALGTCTGEFDEIAAWRPQTSVVNWFGELPVSRVDANFFDRVHYRAAVGQLLAEEIAAAIAPPAAAAH